MSRCVERAVLNVTAPPGVEGGVCSPCHLHDRRCATAPEAIFFGTIFYICNCCLESCLGPSQVVVSLGGSSSDRLVSPSLPPFNRCQLSCYYLLSQCNNARQPFLIFVTVTCLSSNQHHQQSTSSDHALYD